MAVCEKIKEALSLISRGNRIKRLVIGVVYTGVQLDSGGCGVAYTFQAGVSCGHELAGSAGRFGGMRAGEVIQFLGSDSLLDSSIALATANALIGTLHSGKDFIRGDILDVLDLAGGDRVLMVGSFFPVMEKLKNRGIHCDAVDLVPKEGALAAGEVNHLLPESDVAIITATSIINSTIDRLLELSKGCREVVILGSSTPMVQEAFRGTPVTCLSGIRVADAEQVFRVISEGGGFRYFKNYTEKISARYDCL